MSWLIQKLYESLYSNVAVKRSPDVIIGGAENPYLYRWHVIPRNKFFNIYLHHFMRSDDDRALHDHPWVNMSILLKGNYTEVTPNGYHYRTAGHIYARLPSALHRVLLDTAPWGERSCWTLFITGPRVREWGFACPKGWVHWKKFTGEDDSGSSIVGKGCAQ